MQLRLVRSERERLGLNGQGSLALPCLGLTLPDKAREEKRRKERPENDDERQETKTRPGTRQEVDLEREIEVCHFFRGRLFCPLVRVSPLDLHLASTDRQKKIDVETTSIFTPLDALQKKKRERKRERGRERCSHGHGAKWRQRKRDTQTNRQKSVA